LDGNGYCRCVIRCGGCNDDFNVWSGAVGISTLLGLQVLLTGIALVRYRLPRK